MGRAWICYLMIMKPEVVIPVADTTRLLSSCICSLSLVSTSLIAVSVVNRKTSNIHIKCLLAIGTPF